MAGRGLSGDQDATPASLLRDLTQQALEVAKKARRNRKSLSGDNHYGNKFADLKYQATEAFEQLATLSMGDATALAELLASIFHPNTVSTDRLRAQRELTSALRRLSRVPTAAAQTPTSSTNFIPPSILDDSECAYIIAIGRQLNGCYQNGWRDASMVMMRRLLEIGIIEAFEAKDIAHKITGADGNYFHLSKLVDLACAEPALRLSRNTKKALPKLKELGHLSAHGRHFTARQDDVERVQSDFRIAIEELLHHAGLQ
jgi:hypothetical protein